MAAWVNGFLGIFASYLVGTKVLSLSTIEVGLSLFASNLGGLIALLVILQLEWQPWIKKNILTRSRRTWPIFLLIYYAVILLLVPVLRDGYRLLCMALPLGLGNGFAILIFGPIQDQLYRRSQRRARLKKV